MIAVQKLGLSHTMRSEVRTLSKVSEWARRAAREGFNVDRKLKTSVDVIPSVALALFLALNT